MSLETRAFALINAGLLKDAATVIDERRHDLSNELKAIRAQLEWHIGSPDRARASSKELLGLKLTDSEKSICWETVGQVAFLVGEIEEGQKAFKKAFAAAAASTNPKSESRLRASYSEAVLHSIGIEPATVEIPQLRRAAVHTADASSLIALHVLAAEIQTKKGSLAVAKANMATARALLETYPNVVIQGRIEILAAAIAILESDYKSALSCTSSALSAADRSGSNRLRVPALVNFAHIKLALGELHEARSALTELKQPKGGGTAIAILGTELQLALAAGDLQAADELDKELAAVSSTLEGGYSYYGLWYLLTRVKFLYRIGRPGEGLAIAIETIPHIERTADRTLLERMQLLAAEGMARNGNAGQGAALLATAVNANEDPPAELLAEAARVAGRLTAPDNPGAACAFFDRAARILESIENITALAEVRRDAEETLNLSLVTSAPPLTRAATQKNLSGKFVDHRPVTATVAERITALIELSSHPPLMAEEVFSLIADTGCVSRLRLVEVAANGKRQVTRDYTTEVGPVSDENSFTSIPMQIGTYSDREYLLETTPQGTATARATLIAVERLVAIARTIAKVRQERRERPALWADRSPDQDLGLVCGSERTVDLIKTIRRVADSHLTVLLTGETGVGKELFARALHLASPRRDDAFFPFNCSTVPRDMLDSQLFGHRKGAFTGAHEAGPGVIRAAAGGTLFLDEIGEMSLEAQPKLLRFLESGEILPLGESKPVHVDVRVVAATNADLEQLVAQGRFREDLYYRLNVMQIDIPPLRERREEIPALVEHFLERYGREFQKPMLRVADDTLEYLLLYRWPGNVRQLANEIRRLVALVEPGSVLAPAQLSKDIVASRRTVPVPPSETVLPLDQTLAAAIEQLERAVIERALKKCDGRNDEAAKLLGLSRKGLYLKRQRLGV